MSVVELAALFKVTEDRVAACRLPVSPVYADAVNVTLPLTALGVIVPCGSNSCKSNAYFGMLSKVIDVAVHAVSLVQVMRTGCRSGCTTINVSAD
jgi:hypothetical protein